MRILNLVDIKKSQIKYEISRFPDGQQQIKVTSFLQYRLTESKLVDEAIADPIKIYSRLNDFKDLELIYCTVASLRQLRVKEIHLYTPYFLGSRSDRQFEEGSNNYLKHVICPIINSLGFESITVLDPHSDILEACLNGFKKVSNEQLVHSFTNSFWNNGSCVIVSPDAGASKKIYKLAESIKFKGDIITCSKDRDKDGKLTKCIVPTSFNHVNKNFVIIDDICDGGATFINIARELKEQWKHKNPKIYLIVTHGIFSKGFEELSKYFDGIYCTNSYKDISDVSPKYDGFVKQLNVF